MSTETTNAWPALVRSTESGDFFRAPLAATLQGLGALGAAPVLLLLMVAMGDEAEPAPALFMAVACAGAAFFAGQVLFGRARRILEAQPVRFSVVPAIRECVRALAEAGFVWSMVLSTAGLLAVLWTAGDDLEQKLPAAFGAAIVIGVGGWLSLLFAHLFTELASALVEIANNTAGGWAAESKVVDMKLRDFRHGMEVSPRVGVDGSHGVSREKYSVLFDYEIQVSQFSGFFQRPRSSGVVDFSMVVVPPCTFTMGSPTSEPGRGIDETQHEVRLTHGYAIGSTPVTQALWTALMWSNPSGFASGAEAPQRPVEQVKWYEAVWFCNALSEKLGLRAAYTIGEGTDPLVTCDFSAPGFRLPTEAEWECAARANTALRYAGSDDMAAVGWFDGNSGNTTHAVGQKQANALGLYDMSGNVWEWIWDRYGDYPTGSTIDPLGAPFGPLHVYRGGSWSGTAIYARTAYRVRRDPSYRSDRLGFRLARTIP